MWGGGGGGGAGEGGDLLSSGRGRGKGGQMWRASTRTLKVSRLVAMTALLAVTQTIASSNFGETYSMMMS